MRKFLRLLMIQETMAGFEQRYANIFSVKGLAKVLFCLKKAYFCIEAERWRVRFSAS